MAIDLQGDLGTFFAQDDFAIEIAYSLPSGETGQFVGIFDNPASSGALGEVGFIDGAPLVFAPTASLPAGLIEKSVLTVKGLRYAVAHGPEDDGEGVSKITLEDDSP